MQEPLNKLEPLILWGGTDIDPSIYNQKPLKWTQKPDLARDKKELEQLDVASFEDRPIIGVCRGAQLITAWIDGGELYQHVELQPMTTVDITTNGGHKYRAKVDHHQVMIPSSEGTVLAFQMLDKPVKAWISDTEYDLIKFIPMVVYYPVYKAIAIQPHPEWMNPDDPFVEWINSVIKTLLGVNKCF